MIKSKWLTNYASQVEILQKVTGPDGPGGPDYVNIKNIVQVLWAYICIVKHKF